MLQEKQAQIDRLQDELKLARSENEKFARQNAALQQKVDNLIAELKEEKGDREREITARLKTQKELDELRKLLEAKTSEATRRLEVEKSKEAELISLRSRYDEAVQKQGDERRLASEALDKIRLELDQTKRQLQSLSRDYESLLEKEHIVQDQSVQLQSTLAELEKAKRTAESELNALRLKQIEQENEIKDVNDSKAVSLVPSRTNTFEYLSPSR